MSFIDTLKRSLGFEEGRQGRTESVNDLPDNFSDDFFVDDFSISPEQSFYEIVLIKPRSVDDMDYVFDQVVEENNPVIIDLSYLENEGPDMFRMAAEKLKLLREKFNAEAILLGHCENKNLIIIAPNRVKLLRKA